MMTLLGALCIFALGMAVGYEVRRYQDVEEAAEREAQIRKSITAAGYGFLLQEGRRETPEGALE